MSDAVQPKGAYGLEVSGLPHADLLVPVREAGWPRVSVRVQDRSAREDALTEVGNERATLNLDGELVILRRRERSAVFATIERSDPGRLIHPLLTATGTVFAWWHGHEALHGGAFVGERGAWGLLGDRGAGKSSLLAALAGAGHAVLTDDLLVVADGVALAGPRCVDLRSDMIGPAGVAGRTMPVRGDERERLVLGPVSAEVPLQGWILLCWGPGTGVRSLDAGERLTRLSAQRNVQGLRAGQFLDLVRLPAWELTRARDRASLEVAVEMALDVSTRAGQPGSLQQ